MIDNRPGLNAKRLRILMSEAIHRCRLHLSGSVVLTEAATGAYRVTPVLAALAGAEFVYAMTKQSPYGTIAEVRRQTQSLSEFAGVADRIKIITALTSSIVGKADIITNSGHLRPLDKKRIGWMKSTAVIPLMYEAWEYRESDVDLNACWEHGIRVAGTNEEHPCVDVFSFLGGMAVKHLVDAGVAVWGSRIMLLCDNPFAPYIERGLKMAESLLDRVQTLADGDPSKKYDAILVALKPRQGPVINSQDAGHISNTWPGAVVVQFWGDLDRENLGANQVPFWPISPPRAGHMGILPSAIGPEPVVRLQAGGLKVGELLWRERLDPESKVPGEFADICQSIHPSDSALEQGE